MFFIYLIRVFYFHFKPSYIPELAIPNGIPLKTKVHACNNELEPIFTLTFYPFLNNISIFLVPSYSARIWNLPSPKCFYFNLTLHLRFIVIFIFYNF